MALNVKSTPSLGMGEALKLASSRLTVFSGRSNKYGSSPKYEVIGSVDATEL